MDPFLQLVGWEEKIITEYNKQISPFALFDMHELSLTNSYKENRPAQ